MEELYIMIYILVFIIGSIAGLLLSYKKHMEPYIISEIDVLTLVLSIIGWFLLFKIIKKIKFIKNKLKKLKRLNYF